MRPATHQINGYKFFIGQTSRGDWYFDPWDFGPSHHGPVPGGYQSEIDAICAAFTRLLRVHLIGTYAPLKWHRLVPFQTPEP